MKSLSEITQNPLFGIMVTIGVYVLSQILHRRCTWLHPLFMTSTVIILILLLCDIPYEDYYRGGELLVLFLGPATIALGVPLFKQALRISRSLPAILAGVMAGSITGLTSAACLVWLLNGSNEILLSMIPKSVTSPVAIELVRQLGGIPELGAVLAVLTGLLGSMFGPKLLRAAGVRLDVSIGTAIGTASHGIGTARVLRESELQGSVSGLSMGLSAITTSLLVIPLYWWLS